MLHQVVHIEPMGFRGLVKKSQERRHIMALDILAKESEVCSKTNWRIISDPKQNTFSGSNLHIFQQYIFKNLLRTEERK
jgi:hypothetical protein